MIECRSRSRGKDLDYVGRGRIRSTLCSNMKRRSRTSHWNDSLHSRIRFPPVYRAVAMRGGDLLNVRRPGMIEELFGKIFR